ncbi:hypothetical protein GLOTRDRAFT_119123 [Gloeophyllum trabeum ATCC 11539]|uniref:Ras modification protein ERF4 n=1 Tax=Gloeophyllum trabeum (strain ATCC 11539 / FP-39264 / Madison 617) TaxID=670483 RepID=S7S5G5_GLOTA|nr:uncharacterized protein GLOTRDRAFT_119123 [Gloeophyllum trabeum ATCC 11539]EPQ61219.1 hypothetical protein GLOTRDRAFT_119123 [Gloeophyllum trabeum ATCC 11539]
MSSASNPIDITDSHEENLPAASRDSTHALPDTPPSTSSGYDGSRETPQRRSREMPEIVIGRGSEDAAGRSGGETDDAKEEKDEAPVMSKLGLHVAPPTILPPSPPLTRVGTNESEKPEQEQERNAGHHLEESEATHWDRNGNSGDGLVNIKDVLAEGGEEDEATRVGTWTSKRQRRISEHPLQLDLKPPSPVPWEVFDPPTTATASVKHSRAQNRTDGERTLIPKSSYYFGPPPPTSAYGTDPIGQIGVHFPREVLRIERDYSGGELIQFSLTYPLELEGRITPTQFLETMNAINELLISAYSLRHAFVDNALAVFSLQLSRLFFKSHYEKEMERLQRTINHFNEELYNPVGLNILWPRKVAFLFLEIEYY